MGTEEFALAEEMMMENRERNSRSPIANRQLAAVALALALGIMMLSAFACHAESNAVTFDAANKLYEEGKFGEAAAAYEKLTQGDGASAAIYFNLGNAYFKSGQMGRAIAGYHRAEKITPRDPDIRANLQFARNQVQGASFAPDRWQRWLGKLTPNEWTLLACGAVWAWLLLLAGLQWRPALRPSLRGSAVALGVVAGVFCAGLAAAWSARRSAHVAVVVSQDAAAHNGPFDESPTAFRLNDGAEFRVLDEKGEWLQITADGRRIGWMRRDKVLNI